MFLYNPTFLWNRSQQVPGDSVHNEDASSGLLLLNSVSCILMLSLIACCFYIFIMNVFYYKYKNILFLIMKHR